MGRINVNLSINTQNTERATNIRTIDGTAEKFTVVVYLQAPNVLTDIQLKSRLATCLVSVHTDNYLIMSDELMANYTECGVLNKEIEYNCNINFPTKGKYKVVAVIYDDGDNEDMSKKIRDNKYIYSAMDFMVY